MNSIGTLYIECPPQEKQGAFDTKQLSEEEYVRMLREYSCTIGTGLPSFYDNRHGVYNVDTKGQQENINYTNAMVKIYDITGKPCDINELYRIEKNGMGILIIEIFEDEMSDLFETEFIFWKKDSMNINNDNSIDKNDRIRFLPVKDLQFQIDNHVFTFSGCKIYCEYDKLKVALIIQEIKEI